MAKYEATIQQFEEQGEKTGWIYVAIPADIAEAIHPGVKKIYRVKGTIDRFRINAVAILPMGDGSFILPLNAAIRKGIRKHVHEKVTIDIVWDKEPPPISAELLECLQEDPKAREFFESLSTGHQRYFSNWIESAKTETTKAKRIAVSISGLHRQMDYGAIIREQKEKKNY